MKQLEPKNGLYLTRDDFPSFPDSFAEDCAFCGKKKDDTYVKDITFCVTENCNLACTYCYECHKTNERMDLQTAKRIVDSLFEGELVDTATPAVVLNFIGGEPLLEIDLIDQTVDYFKKKSFSLGHPWAYYYMISISTNGVLYDTPKVQEFIKKNREHLSIGISIDGDKDLHDSCRVFHDGTGSYDIVSKSVKKLLSQFPTTGTKVTLAPENISYLPKAVKHLYEMGYHNIYANCVFEDVWKDEHPFILYKNLIEVADWMVDNELYKNLMFSMFDENLFTLKGISPKGKEDLDKTSYCGGNGQMLAFGTDGRIYPCLRYMKHSLTNQPERPIGDIKTGLYTDKEHTEWFQKLKTVTTWSSADSECRTCGLLAICPTCIAWQYDATGDPNKKTKHHCKMFKAQVWANQYYWWRLYKKLSLDEQSQPLIEPKENKEA